MTGGNWDNMAGGYMGLAPSARQGGRIRGDGGILRLGGYVQRKTCMHWNYICLPHQEHKGQAGRTGKESIAMDGGGLHSMPGLDEHIRSYQGLMFTEQ